MSTVLEKIQGEPHRTSCPRNIQAELEAAAKKHGFKDFAEYDEVVGNISMVMAGIDPKTKAFTEPAVAIKKEIEDVTADKSIPDGEKKQMLEELNEALKVDAAHSISQQYRAGEEVLRQDRRRSHIVHSGHHFPAAARATRKW